MPKSTFLRNILIISVLAVLFLPVFTAIFILPSFSNIIIAGAEKDAVHHASHLSSHITITSDELTSANLSKNFMEEVLRIKDFFKMEKIRIYSSSGEIVYSTDQQEIGQFNRKKYFHEIVAKGNTFQNLVTKDSESLEGLIVTVDVVETYVPIIKDDKFFGAFEIYYDITQQKKELASLITSTLIIVFSFTFILLIAVLATIGRANKYLTQRDQAESDLRKHLDQLEDLVQERTAELEQAFIGLEEEIRDREKAEAQLLQAQKMEAIGTLAGGIAHDFNNILGAIIGYTDLAMVDKKEDANLADNLMQVKNAAYRAKDLTAQILAFSRQQEIDIQPVVVAKIVEEILKLLRATIPSSIEIKQTIASKNGKILADPSQIHQVLMNLCTNASQAMEDRGGILEVRLEEVDIEEKDIRDKPEITSSRYLHLTVTDTGKGMNQVTLDRIFDPFFTTKEKGEGTGLGLSVVHGIVKSHGGEIQVASEPEKGTSFHLYFPLLESPIDLEEDKKAPLPKGNERVLLVEDEWTLAEMEKKMLENLGYSVVAATSSLKAMQIFIHNPDQFDIVITDQTMPQVSGMELASSILKIRPDIPIILSTGFSKSVTKEKTESIGIKEIIIKPFDMHQFAALVRKTLDGQ